MLEGVGSKCCMNFEGFTNTPSVPRTTLGQNTLWLHCAFSNYRCETKFQILFEILAFLVHGKNRNGSTSIPLQVEYVSTWLLAVASQYWAPGIKDDNCLEQEWPNTSVDTSKCTACGLLHLGFWQKTCKIVDDKTNRLECTTVVWRRKFRLRLRMHTLPIIFCILWYLNWQLQCYKLHAVNYGIRTAGLNERKAPGKVLTARPPKHLAQLRSISHSLVSTLQKHRSETPKLFFFVSEV